MTARNKETGEIIEFEKWDENCFACMERMSEQELAARGYSKFSNRCNTRMISKSEFERRFEVIEK